MKKFWFIVGSALIICHEAFCAETKENREVTVSNLVNMTNKKFNAQNEEEPDFLDSYISYPPAISKIDAEINDLRNSLEKIEKGEWETTSMYNKRRAKFQCNVNKQISMLEAKKKKIIAKYEEESKLLKKKKEEYHNNVSWDSITGKYIVNDVVLIYKVSSIKYDADSGKFDIDLQPSGDQNINVREDFSIRVCEPYNTKHLTISIPDIEKAKTFKENFKGCVMKFSSCPMNLSYEHVRIKDAVYETEVDAGGVAVSLLELGLSLLVGQDVTNGTGGPDWTKKVEVSPAEYQWILYFCFDAGNLTHPDSIENIMSEQDFQEYLKSTSLYELSSSIIWGN